MRRLRSDALAVPDVLVAGCGDLAHTGMGVGLLPSGAVLTIAHVGEVVQVPLLAALMVLSVVFSIAYEETGTLLAPVVGQATFNAGTRLLTKKNPVTPCVRGFNVDHRA